MIDNLIKLKRIYFTKKIFLLQENNKMDGPIPVECFQNSNLTYFDVGKDIHVLIHAYFCLQKTKLIIYVVCIGNNNLTGSISTHIENLKNIKVLFLGEQFLF